MSLRLKMILGIGTILLLVVLVYAIVASSSLSNNLLSITRHEANLVAAIADRALGRAMEEGDQPVVQAILRRLGEQPDVVGIRILNPQGTIRYSTKPAEVGTALPLHELPIEGGGLEPIWDLPGRTVGVFRQLPNSPSCVRCHSRRLQTLGYLNVLVAFPVIEGETRQHWTTMIFTGIVALLAAGGLIWLFLTLVVERRVDSLAQAMRRVKSGDLSARAVADDADELGQLALSFNEMVTELADARRQLEDRHTEEIRRAEHLASLGQMAAGIAHEINNPIAGMLSCVRSLLKGAKSEQQRQQSLEMLREGLGRIGRIVGQLLNFAREAKPQFASTDLRMLLENCASLIREECEARGVACEMASAGAPPAIWGDRYQLEQVFQNILKNSLDAMPAGGRITIAAGARAGADGSEVEVRIADTGIGIPPQDLSRVFDPFFTTKDVGKGTGLGLSVSYGIVKAHGGTIQVASQVGKGTVFTVSLPVRGRGRQ